MISVRNLATAFGRKRILRAARIPRTGSASTPMAALGPMNFSAGPIVWVDCEMSGLNPRKDRLLEIAILITNGNMELVDEGIEFVIKNDSSVLENMDEWCKTHHGQSGLTRACLSSLYSKDDVSKAILQYIKRWIPEPRTAVLAGNSVHVDRSFLIEEMPEVIDWLHYRIIDVSTIKELCRRWYPKLEVPKVLFGGSHRALDDIQGSIRELTWYRENIFREPADL